jgi:hypothetical protein
LPCPQIIDPFVEVEVIGLPVDCSKEQTRVVDDNGEGLGLGQGRVPEATIAPRHVGNDLGRRGQGHLLWTPPVWVPQVTVLGP